ncbi:unnamed protein product [Psylliodes chrysocephalus]|uniref:Uncharacterized protein n=1 Tax=Psylliodes chrysocephalus TaxID=3402493 RepID=A0A9P0G9J8_9CUCU|nr:unnamed protein product [Psylliodes chrysocephala]
MLKYLFLLAFISTAYCALDEKDFPPKLVKLAKMMHFECQTITGATEEEIKKLRKGDFNGSDEIKRYATCCWLHSGLLDVHFNIDKDFLLDIEPEKLKGKFVDLYEKCAEKGKNSGLPKFIEKVWIAKKCIHDADPENFIVL